MSNEIRIVVYGMPGPQGSKSFMGMRGGHAVLVESSKKVKPWRKAVCEACDEAKREYGFHPVPNVSLFTTFDGPLVARMVFTLPKPKSAPKRSRTWPDKKPDLSKLVRSTEDALTDAGIWADDARAVEYSRAAKVFPGEDPEALDRPGCVITVQRLGVEGALAVLGQHGA